MSTRMIEPSAVRSWRMPPLIAGSVAVHLGAAVGVGASPTVWPWALGAVAASHLAMTVAGLVPTSGWLGPNLRRLPQEAEQGAPSAGTLPVALTFDDGPDPQVTPRVLDSLDAAGAKASFFCIGWRAREHPGLCREIVARGHSVENHGDAHSWAFSLYGPGRMSTDVSTAQATLSDITGQAPMYFRPTAGLRNPFLEPVLAKQGLHLASWSQRAYDTRTADVDCVVRRLTQHMRPRDILLMHDGNSPRMSDGEPAILCVLPKVLAFIQQNRWRAVGLPRPMHQ